ncbi:hypothetical protein AVL50_16395 [Flammeovirga sp. SJP92]|nr:hypothetical protein AVL50_16395 [Flammeovirga sp. SJP92]
MLFVISCVNESHDSKRRTININRHVNPMYNRISNIVDTLDIENINTFFDLSKYINDPTYFNKYPKLSEEEINTLNLVKLKDENHYYCYYSTLETNSDSLIAFTVIKNTFKHKNSIHQTLHTLHKHNDVVTNLELSAFGADFLWSLQKSSILNLDSTLEISQTEVLESEKMKNGKDIIEQEITKDYYKYKMNKDFSFTLLEEKADTILISN